MNARCAYLEIDCESERDGEKCGKMAKDPLIDRYAKLDTGQGTFC